MRHNTKEEILTLADNLIRSKGYNAFSFADIAAAMDVRPPAIHYYFPTKVDLASNVIDRESRRMLNDRSRLSRAPADEQLRQIMTSFYRNSRQHQICLTGSLTAEYSTFAPSMQKKVAEMCQITLDWMAWCLDQGRKEKKLHFEGRPADRALLVMSTLMSGLLLCRTLGMEVFDNMMNQLLTDLKTLFRVDDLDPDDPPFFVD